MTIDTKYPGHMPAFAVGVGPLDVSSRNTLVMNSAYTFGSAGAAYAVFFNAPVSSSLTDVYFFSTALNGTAASTSIGCELRNCTTSGVAGSTLHASQTATVTSTANKWSRITFGTPFTLVAGTTYALLFYNASASPTVDYPTICTTSSISRRHFGVSFGRTSANGGSTYSSLNQMPLVVIKAGTECFGCPYSSTHTATTSNTNERGVLLTTSFAVPVPLVAVHWNSEGNFVNTRLKIIKATTAPDATPGTGELLVTFATGIPNMDFCWITPVTLDANTSYRVVSDPEASSTTRPRYFSIEDYSAFSDVQAAVWYGGTMQYTEQSGSSWVDYPERLPSMLLAFGQIPAVSSGGGSRIVNVRGGADQ